MDWIEFIVLQPRGILARPWVFVVQDPEGEAGPWWTLVISEFPSLDRVHIWQKIELNRLTILRRVAAKSCFQTKTLGQLRTM